MMQARLRESCLRPRRSRSGASRRALLAFGLASLALPNLALPASAQRSGLLSLRATFGERGPEITEELIWRVYSVRGTDAQLVQQSAEIRPNFSLPPGEYAVHASHGLATAIRSVTVTEIGTSAVIPVNAGALVVSGHIGGPERPMPPARQTLRLFIPTANNSEGRLVTNVLRPGAVLRLPEGTYHLVSTYTGTNSVVRSDVKIETGKVTEAAVNHRAATMTLKLVRAVGGAAFAGTQWTIETPGGDIVAEAAGAFPDVDIAEGAYTVTARHNDREYKGQMKVEGGVNRDFEIIVE